MERLLERFGGLLCLVVVPLEALLGFFDRLVYWGTWCTPGCRGGVGGCSLSKRMFYEQASPLRHVRPILQTFFCHPYAVYMRPNGFAHAHLIFCTPHRQTGVGDDL